MINKEKIQSEGYSKAKKNEEIQRKIKATKDKKKEQDPNYIKHFGVWIDKRKFNLEISKDTYAKIDKRVSSKNIDRFWKALYSEEDVEEIIKANYEDEKCTTYNDNWCKAHREDCLRNFTLNMEYFNNIDKNEFNTALNKLLKKNKGFVEVKDLELYNKVSGLYIMVLDKYKQIYIGQSNDLKGRIVKHWKQKKRFDRLMFGNVENSILSIDSFEVLDTSRIFINEYDGDLYTLDQKEKKLTKSISNKYLLNRTEGGIRDMWQGLAIDILAHKNNRKFNK